MVQLCFYLNNSLNYMNLASFLRERVNSADPDMTPQNVMSDKGFYWFYWLPFYLCIWKIDFNFNDIKYR